MGPQLIALLMVAPFAGVFVYSGYHELRERRRHGGPSDPRQPFEFDTSAPSFEAGDDDPAGAGKAIEAAAPTTETQTTRD